MNTDKTTVTTIQIETGESSLKLRLPCGAEFSLIFLPYEKGGSPKCMDIIRTDTRNGTVFNGETDVPTHDLKVFGAGPVCYDSRNDPKRHREQMPHRATVTTILID